MAFQRSFSKVWWGSDNTSNFYANFGNNTNDFHSLDSHFKFSANLSRIQEVEENSHLWRSNNSPGSLRSQDSGFSDHDDSNPQPNSKESSPSKSNYSSPRSVKTIETPPTVLRRKQEIISPVYSSRRISFSVPSSPNSDLRSDNKESDLINQIDNMNFINYSSSNSIATSENISLDRGENQSDDSEDISPIKPAFLGLKDSSIKRRRVIIRRKTRKNTLEKNRSVTNEHCDTTKQSSNQEMKISDPTDYNNETVYFGTGHNYDSDSKLYNDSLLQNTLETDMNFIGISSTPKVDFAISKNFITNNDDLENSNGITLPYHFEYENPLLNGHALSVQYWLDDIRNSYDHEIMSTLQTKSITQEAFRNLKITTNSVAKIIRQLQTRSFILQNEFERMERILKTDEKSTLQNALFSSEELTESVKEFVKVLERRSVFFTEYRNDKKKFVENIEHINLILKDLKISLQKQHYLDIESLYEDIQLLKRYLLITIRLVFEKLIKVIVVNIENTKCDLMLRANLNMIATLSNIDYVGFASLTDAFIKNQTERALLLICLDSKFPSVRALALRSLATICATSESIKQFSKAGGMEIIRDILAYDVENERSEPEKREAVSLLTQITAPWHGKEHRVFGLKDCIETIVEGITDIITTTNCCQTLLLCAASLNNLSRLEMTSIYSIMSNETVIKLKDVVEGRGPGVSIFLYEQIVTMLLNMSLNKKCHSHLANRNIINFITYIFQSQFYEKFQSRAECEAHRKTIKTILHIFKRLIHESLIGQEILEHNFIPIFSKVEKDLIKNSQLSSSDDDGGKCEGNNIDADGYYSEYSKDISLLNRQLNESMSNKSFNRSMEGRSSTNRLNLTRQESYV